MRSHLKNAVTSNHENYRAIVNQMRAQLAAGDLDESSRAIWFSCVNGLIDGIPSPRPCCCNYFSIWGQVFGTV